MEECSLDLILFILGKHYLFFGDGEGLVFQTP